MVTRKIKPGLEAWDFQSPLPPPHLEDERDQGLEMELIIHCAYVKKFHEHPHNPGSMEFRELFRLVKYIYT